MAPKVAKLAPKMAMLAPKMAKLGFKAVKLTPRMAKLAQVGHPNAIRSAIYQNCKNIDFPLVFLGFCRFSGSPARPN